MENTDAVTTTNHEFDFDVHLVPGSIKTAMKDAEAGSRDLWQVSPFELHLIENFNVRVNTEKHLAKVREIADSMLSEGYYQDKPLAGYVAKEDGKQKIYVYDGHTRLAAVKLALEEGANIDRVPVVVSQAGISMEDLTVALVRGNSGEPLAPYEMGIVCKRLVRFGMEIPMIATRIGVTEQYVKNLLSLMAAPVEIRNMVIQDRVAASTAIDVIAKHGEKALAVLEKAESKANGAGKSRVTGKHVDPASEFKKAIREQAFEMFEILKGIANDEGSFNGLTSDLADRLARTLGEIPDVAE